MAKIHRLPEKLVSQIAAGEVIERPVYALKELIENALDAGADEISIVLEQAGLKKITVSDNGEGMSEEDLKESIHPHTTSKISTEDDLQAINTMGFRGEALSSIASISDLVIKTKQKGQVAGTQITVQAGKVKDISPVGMPFGTIVEVSNLFYPVPARKKFLKHTTTEWRYCSELVSSYAVAFPEISFQLVHNKKTILDLPKKQTRLERTVLLLGKSLLEHFMPLEHQQGYLKITGFVGTPQAAQTNQNKQFIYINNRKVTDKKISIWVKESYGTILDTAFHPSFILFMEMPPETIDVNVHPRKEQVHLLNNQLIGEEIKNAVTEVLQKHNLGFAHLERFSKDGLTDSFAGQLLKEETPVWNVKEKIVVGDVQQIHDLYLIAQTNRGLIIIDQHAAHERILYEQFLDEFQKQKIAKTIVIKKPLVIELSISDSQILEEHLDDLKMVGFVIEPFGENSFKISEVPMLFKDRDVKQIIVDVLADFGEEGTNQIDQATNQMIMYLACRSAIKAGEKLTKEEAIRLIKKLEETNNNVTCPHGRPTKIEITLRELNKNFKRS